MSYRHNRRRVREATLTSRQYKYTESNRWYDGCDCCGTVFRDRKGFKRHSPCQKTWKKYRKTQYRT